MYIYSSVYMLIPNSSKLCCKSGPIRGKILLTWKVVFQKSHLQVSTQSSVLAWRIPGMGSHRIGHD